VLPPPAARHRVLLVDPPRFAAFGGFGPADAAGLLARFLDRLGLRRIGLAGHSLGALAAAELAARRPEQVRRLAPVTPTVWGERDRLVPARLAEDWCSELRAGRALVVPGAGHVPMFDAPAEVAAALLSFFEEVEDETGDVAGR
jgi:pimeloyl-ACP methyl ester carboxylesterase